ncbi:hypothetical protein dqs_3398 [Azoarcus olearius]|uniref:glycosyltransferase family 2 protein n=1 Tax=Azoarcus sp. (strain BH72) TaxID=418699 RepID=UPI0008063952|nr:glycosyltransferase family 2 protein [Azoarcus olearius]ANQ86419.1 hypothetical protein dqs_3398 [Azoarcus olearius]
MQSAHIEMQPTVSVIIPCFNSGPLLEEAVESVRAQEGDVRILEIILVDDGSTDSESLAVLERCGRFEGVRVLINNRTKGPAGARNAGAASAGGEWLAFLDADDVWTPTSLTTRLEATPTNPGAGVISGDFQLLDMATGVTDSNFFQNRERPARYFGPAYTSSRPVSLPQPYLDVLRTAICHVCGTLIRRTLFLDAGGFDERLRYKEDHHLWFKLARLSDFILVPRSVFLYRQHDSNMTHAKVAPFDYERLMLDLILSETPGADIAATIHQRYPQGLIENARWLRGEGKFGRAVTECAVGLWRYPTGWRLWQQLLGSALRLR